MSSAKAKKISFQVALDSDLRRLFKTKCVENEITMAQQVEKLIKAWLTKN